MTSHLRMFVTKQPSPEVIDRATEVIIKAVQREAFKEEFEVIAQSSSENDSSRNEAKARKKSLKKSTLYQLDPYVDDACILGSLRIDDFRTTTPLDCVRGLLRMLIWALAGVAPKSTPLLTAIRRRPRKSRT